MGLSEPSDAARVLADLTLHDEASAASAVPLVYDELRQLAAALLKREAPGHTLQPTALVHEAYLRLDKAAAIPAVNRSEFLAIAARVIRQILVDHARKKKADKRGGNWGRITLSEQESPQGASDHDIVAIDDALLRLAELSERQARVVELRFFGGMTIEETSEILGVSERTVRGDWQVAKAWLWRELGGLEA